MPADPVTSPAPDRLDFTEVYEAEFTYVWNTLRRLGARGATVDDLLQEVFLTVLGRLDTFERGRPLRPWLFGFCYRICSEHRRAAVVRREVPSEQLEPSREDSRPDSPHAQVEAREARQLILDALAALPLERRAVLVLHELEGRAASEIAELLSIPQNTVYSRIRVGRQELIAALRSLGAEEHHD